MPPTNQQLEQPNPQLSQPTVQPMAQPENMATPSPQTAISPESAINELQDALVKVSEIFMNEITSIADRVSKLEGGLGDSKGELDKFKGEIRDAIKEALAE